MRIPNIASSMPVRIVFALACIALFVLVGALALGNYRREAAIAAFERSASATSSMAEMLGSYHTLLRQIGPEASQDILVRSLPIDAKSHMVDHTTGEFLYKTQGVHGVALCKPYFSGACFHGFIIAMISDRGIGDLKSLFDTCSKGLSHDQEANCAHAVGHSFLMYVGYAHLPDALGKCDSEFASSTDEHWLCYNGVFMENGVGHTGESNTSPDGSWNKTSDPMYPCFESAILQKDAHEACWFMQSQFTLRSEAHPQFDAKPAKAGAYCDTLSPADTDICYNGIALQVQRIANNDYAQIRSLCSELESPYNKRCVWVAAQTAYFFGDHAPDSGTMHVCADENGRDKGQCYHALFAAIIWSYSNDSDRMNACHTLPEKNYAASCADLMRDTAAVNQLSHETIVDH